MRARGHPDGITRSYADGRVYEGEFVDDMRTGDGVLRAASGEELYRGTWLHGKRNDHGVGVAGEATSAAPQKMLCD